MLLKLIPFSMYFEPTEKLIVPNPLDPATNLAIRTYEMSSQLNQRLRDWHSVQGTPLSLAFERTRLKLIESVVYVTENGRFAGVGLN